MRIGVDVFTIRELELDPIQTIDYLHERGFEGAQFGAIRSLSKTLDTGELRAIRDYADDKNMYTHISVSQVNPVAHKLSFDELKKCLEEEIKAAAAGGWHELHSAINADSERYTHKVAWSAHVEGCIKLINQLRPTLEKYGSRINIEPHGEATFDILKVIESTGSHLTGVCLDTANTFVNAEDPILAAKRVAPYVHLTHTKDAIVSMNNQGILRQGRPPGMGDVDFETILPILGKYCPELPLSIEDHKWLFTVNIYDKEWIEKNPELTAFELGQFVQYAYKTQLKINSGEIPLIDEYEKTPYLDEMEERLNFGQNYLNKLLKKLDLYG